MNNNGKYLIPSAPPKDYEPKWDKFHSTYFWKLHMDIKHPENRTPELTGYSKKEFQREAQDKEQMLKTKILNLFQKGYFNKIVKWEISQRVGEYIDPRRDPCILILYPRTYEIPELNREAVFKKFAPFLNDFYNRIEKGMSMDGIITVRKSTKSADEFLNVEQVIHKLPTIKHLYSYMLTLSKHGHADGMINQFYLQVKEAKKW
jgi:hypothetical protein